MGIVLPEPGEAHIEGVIVPEEKAMEYAARKLLDAKNPTLHPGPLVLWNWNEKAAKKAKAIKILAECIPARIIPCRITDRSIRRSIRTWRSTPITPTSPSGTTRRMYACSWGCTVIRPIFR